MSPSRPDNLLPLTLIDFDRIRRLARMIVYAEERGMTEFTFTFLLATGERRRLRIIPGVSYPHMANFGESVFDALRGEIYDCFERTKEENCSECERESLRREMIECITEFKNLKARIAHLLATKLYYGVLGRMSSEMIANVHIWLSNDQTQRSAGGFQYAYGLYYNQNYDAFDALFQLRQKSQKSVLGDESETMDELRRIYSELSARGKALENEGTTIQCELKEMKCRHIAISAEIKKLNAEYQRLKNLRTTKKEGEEDVEIAQISEQIVGVKAQFVAYRMEEREIMAQYASSTEKLNETFAAYNVCKERAMEIEGKMQEERRRISREKAQIRERTRAAFEHHDRAARWMDEEEQAIAGSPLNPLHAHGRMVVGAKQRCAEAGEELAQLRMFSDAYLGRAYFFDMPREEGATMPYVRYRESLPAPRRNSTEEEA